MIPESEIECKGKQDDELIEEYLKKIMKRNV